MRMVIKTTLFMAIFSITICTTATGADKKPDRFDCDVHAGPCIGNIEDIQITLDVKPKPVKAMKDLTFTVHFVGAKIAAQPYIDLGMPGMNMGRNRVSLKRIKESLYQGTGVIVR
jgi:hypothetical protein